LNHTEFNIYEVFELAKQIERNGVSLYTSAAKKFPEFSKRSLFLNLAEMEREHEKTFEKMQQELANREGEMSKFLDPDLEAVKYLQTVAKGAVFDVNKDISSILSGVETVSELLRIAIELEKDSVIYYMGIKQVVPESFGKEKVDSIIEEEMSHITLLNSKLSSL